MESSDVQAAPSGLGRAIAVRRTELGLKRKDLAERSSLSYPYVSELEKGTKEPSARALRQLAEALGLSPTELLALSEHYAGEDGQASARRSAIGDAKPGRVGSSSLGPEAGAQLAYLLEAVRATSDSQHGLSNLAELVARLVHEELEAFKRDELPSLVAVELQRTLANALRQGERS